MLDEGNDTLSTDLETPEEQPPEESNNRTFLIVGGIFAGLIFLALVCIAVYVLWLGPRLSSQKQNAQATIEAQNAQVAMQMTATADAALWTPTPLPSPTPTKTPIPTVKPVDSPTPVLAVNTPVPPTATPTTDPATLAAMQAQLAQQMTATANAMALVGTPAGAMPKTGFFDQVGLPTLGALTLVLLVVIFLARRMRRLPMK